jgi:hypothetical protein
MNNAGEARFIADNLNDKMVAGKVSEGSRLKRL